MDWVFYNATGGEYIIGHGGGAMSQHSYCTSITWAEAQIGDLVFYPEDTHVGIVCGWDESGNILILHCASGYNNVVITGQEGFTSIGRPIFYGVLQQKSIAEIKKSRKNCATEKGHDKTSWRKSFASRDKASI